MNASWQSFAESIFGAIIGVGIVVVATHFIHDNSTMLEVSSIGVLLAGGSVRHLFGAPLVLKSKPPKDGEQ